MLLAPHPCLAAAQQARNLLMDLGNRIGSAHQMLTDMGADEFAALGVDDGSTTWTSCMTPKRRCWTPCADFAAGSRHLSEASS